mgnify:CR=1 FL=1
MLTTAAKEFGEAAGDNITGVIMAGMGMDGTKGIEHIKSVGGVTIAQNEAESNFGNPDVYIEKYIEESRHVEIQILADKFGNTVHLRERECSIQRRHQKLLEETPSPAINNKIPEIKN